MHVSGGKLESADLGAPEIRIHAMGDLGAKTPLQLTANNVQLSAPNQKFVLTPANNAQASSLTLTGMDGAAAQNILGEVRTNGYLTIDTLNTARISISTSGPSLNLSDGTIEDEGWFRQQSTTLYVVNKNKFAGLSPLADIQAATDLSGRVNFEWRNGVELNYGQQILHHRQPFLTTNNEGAHPVTALWRSSNASTSARFRTVL